MASKTCQLILMNIYGVINEVSWLLHCNKFANKGLLFKIPSSTSHTYSNLWGIILTSPPDMLFYHRYSIGLNAKPRIIII